MRPGPLRNTKLVKFIAPWDRLKAVRIDACNLLGEHGGHVGSDKVFLYAPRPSVRRRLFLTDQILQIAIVAGPLTSHTLPFPRET